MSWLGRLQTPRENPRSTMPTPQPVAVGSLQQPAPPEANDPAALAADPDRWCWPHSPEWNSGEIDTFTAMVSRFSAKGLMLAQAEALAEKLVTRDREGLDMGACLECQHCTGSRCTAPARAGLGTPGLRAFDVHPIRDRLQRCSGFQPTN